MKTPLTITGTSKNGEEFIGGIPPCEHQPPGVPAHWLAYFFVSDCDATSAKAKELGAKLYIPPTDFEDVGGSPS